MLSSCWEDPTCSSSCGGRDILAEASTQSFFHARAHGNISAPAIPAVYDTFCKGGYHFLAMEKVDLPPLEGCNDCVVERIASAFQWLLDQKSSVPEALFGRISESNARVWHPFFKEYKAPVPFINPKALTNYTKAHESAPRGHIGRTECEQRTR